MAALRGVPVITRPEYTVTSELAPTGHQIVHVHVRKWTAKSARQFRKDIDAAHALIGVPLFVVVPPDRPNLPKFLLAHGFLPDGVVTNQRGELAPFFMRPLNHGRFDNHYLR